MNLNQLWAPNFQLNFNDSMLTEGRYDPFNFRAVFLAGSPGSGKSTIVNKLGLERLGLKLSDIDHTLARMKMLKRADDISHRDAWPIHAQRQNLWINNYLGLIINGTGKNVDRVVELKHQLQSSGYECFMLYIEVDKQVAARRLATRPDQSQHFADRGRQVPAEYFNETYDRVVANLEHFQVMFGEDLAVVTNNDELVESSSLLDRTLATANKKLRRFLTRPLNAIAQDKIAHYNR